MRKKQARSFKVLYWLAQCSWGFLQTLAGAVLYAMHTGCHRTWYRNARVTYWKQGSGLSLGGFIFIPESRPEILVHEYGHTVQSLLLGPLFLPVVGVPSIFWAGLPQMTRLRRERHISYYSRFPENWANQLGEKITGEAPPLW